MKSLNFVLLVLLHTLCLLIISSCQKNDVNIGVNIDADCDITVDLSNSGIDEINTKFISASSCIKNITLSNNTLGYLTPGIFDGQSALEYLDLSKNKLGSQNLFAYGGSKKLKVLKVDHNENSKNLLKCEAFKPLLPNAFPELEYLSMKQICLTVLPGDWKTRMPKLKYLDISENSFNIYSWAKLSFLETIPSTVTHISMENALVLSIPNDKLKNIVSLNVNRNNIVNLVPNSFKDMSNLKFLYMSDCKLANVNTTFTNNLIELDFSNNNLKEISDETFKSCSNSLSNLDLSRNNLYITPSLNLLNNLTKLSLDGMKNKVLMQALEFFPEMKKLKVLSMRHNELTAIPAAFFNKLPLLEELDLSNNSIAALPTWTTQNSLKRLILNKNSITSLDHLSLYQTKSLQLLDVRNNAISSINVASWKNASSDLTLLV